MKRNKVIFLDWGIFLHRSIFAWRNMKNVPAEYICLNMMLSCLRKIGVSPFDKIIIACDYGRSWRRKVEEQYKANRKEFRESYKDVDWKAMYQRFDNLLKKLDRSTDWYIVKEKSFEADDWMAVGSRYYKDNEVILVTYDADMEQLGVYDNVKIFSPLVKYKSQKGAYKIIKDPYKLLTKKIEKETADNLTNPILSEEDYEKRKMIVSLLELPDYVENPIKETYDEIEEGKYIKEEINLAEFPFTSLREKYANLYNTKDKVITYKECIEYQEKKSKRKKKKSKQRRKKNGNAKRHARRS